MAWKLKNTTRAIQRWPALQGVTILTLPSGGDSADFWEVTEEKLSVVPSEKVEEFFPMGPKGTSAITRCPCDCKRLPKFTEEEVDRVQRFLGVRPQFPQTTSSEDIRQGKIFNNLREGMDEELEHCDITGGDPILTAKIALSHLKEDPDYYVKLKKAGL
jgi:hypothetical protein